MNTKEKARVQAGQIINCEQNHSTARELSDEQRDLLAKLVGLAEQLELFRATVAMLELDRLRLQSELRTTGWRPPTRCGGDV